MPDLDFSRRANLEELMDSPCAYEELRACLRHLSLINRLTAAYRPTMRFLERLTEQPRPGNRPLRIVDVGCGYGDALRRIERWAAGRGIAVSLAGVDINANAIRAAREATPPGSAIEWHVGDVTQCAAAAHADVILASLLTHHLREDEIIALLRWMERTATAGWFINDLHRRPVPYHLFGLLMHGPWWHHFTRADGMASIRRSFLREDWERLCAAAGVSNAVSIQEYTPARLCVARIKPARPAS